MTTPHILTLITRTLAVERQKHSYSLMYCAMAASKTVLVCVGERKRAVVINDDEKSSFLDIVITAFADVLEEKPIKKPVIQIKSEQWKGEFVDFEEGSIIPDKSVVRIIDDDVSSVKP